DAHATTALHGKPSQSDTGTRVVVSVGRAVTMRGSGAMQAQVVGQAGNEQAVGGLSFILVNGVSKKIMDKIHVSAHPRDLDCVPHGPLYVDWGDAVDVCHLRIEAGRDAMKKRTVLYGQGNG